MTNTIDLTQSVAMIIEDHPEVQDILVELGFKPLANPVMLKTVGRATSLVTGSKMTKIPLDKIRKTLEFNGYDVIGGE